VMSQTENCSAKIPYAIVDKEVSETVGSNPP